MGKPPRAWTAARHCPVVKVDDNLWSVESDVLGIPGFNTASGTYRGPAGYGAAVTRPPRGRGRTSWQASARRPRPLECGSP
jgi:hypothetical protein